MDKAIRQFVTASCLRVEQKLNARLRHEIDRIGQIIEKTIAKKEDVQSLQEQIDELKRS